jgi:hypothetical protein
LAEDLRFGNSAGPDTLLKTARQRTHLSFQAAVEGESEEKTELGDFEEFVQSYTTHRRYQSRLKTISTVDRAHVLLVFTPC